MKRLIYIPYRLKQGITQVMCGETYTYNEVISPSTNKIWLDRNLGASTLPSSYNDSDGYGALFQWGRLIDGHQCISWRTITPVNGITHTLSLTDNPGNSDFIVVNSSPYDWRSGQNDNLWQGNSPINDICPAGYRIPTRSEFEDELSQFITHSNKLEQAYNSFLKIPANGYRSESTGDIALNGSVAALWTSTTIATYAYAVYATSGTIGLSSLKRAIGLPIRCIKINQPTNIENL